MTLLDREGAAAALAEVQESYDVLFDYLAVTDDLAPSDAIVCFGSRDPLVPVRAARLYHDGFAPIVVTTGGVALHAGRSEADVFADELISRDVPADRVLVERDSSHTGDNVSLALALLRVHGAQVASVVAVAWPFAARRCRATFARHAPTLTVRSAPSFDRPGVRTPLTATTARWALEQLDRLRRYAAAGEIAEVIVPAAVTAAAAAVREALAAVTSG